MADITELAQSLKSAAENAGADCWQAKKISGDFYVIRKGSYKRECGYTTYQPIAEIDHKPTRDYVAMANPASVLALIEALEKAQQRIVELESRTVTVKLPEPPGPMSVGARTVYFGIVADVVSAFQYGLNAAGIKVEAE